MRVWVCVVLPLTLFVLALMSDGAWAFAPAPMKEDKGDPLPKAASARLGSVRLRHGTGIQALCFSPDGRSIVASGGGSNNVDNAVYLWDATDGTRRYRQVIDSGRAVAFSPDGKRVAVVASLSEKGDRGVLVLEAATGKEQHRLEVPAGVGQLCFCPQSKQLAILAGSGGDEKDELLLWQPGQKPRRFDRPKGWGTGIAFSPDGKQIAAGLLDSGERSKKDGYPICVWEAASGKRTHLLQGHEDDVRALAFTSDGHRLVSGGWGEGNSVRLWDLKTGKELSALPNRKGEALALWLAADDKTLLGVGGEGQLRGWELPGGKSLVRLPKLDPSPGRSLAVAFSADGKRLAMGSPGPTSVIYLWDLTTGGRMLRQVGHEAEVTGLAFTANGKRLASCAADGAILWDLSDRRPIRRFGSRKLAPETMALSPDGSLLALSESDTPTVHLFDTANGKAFPAITWALQKDRFRQDRVERESVRWLSIAPDGRSLVAAVNGKARMWRLSTGRTVEGDPHVLYGEGRELIRGSFTRDGKAFLAGTGIGVIRWDAANGKQTSRAGEAVDLWSEEAGFGSAAALSPDGKLLAVGGNSGVLSLWDTSEAKEVARLLKDADDWWKGFRAVAFSPDGKTLASGDRSGVIRFWDVASRKEFARREGHAGLIRALVFSPDGKTLASGGSDTTVLLWPVPARKN
jgi:WD40 repeat protein